MQNFKDFAEEGPKMGRYSLASLGFCGTSLDVENFLKGKCVLVSSGNIFHMSKF